MTISEAKKVYNKYLKQYYKGEEILDSKKYEKEDEERYLERFRFIMSELNRLLVKIGFYSQQEILEGFKI